MRKRSLSILLALGLVLGLVVGALGTASAQPAAIGDEATSQVFFPWVANGSDADGTGPYYGTITLQNVHPGPNVLNIYVAGEDGGWDLAETIALQAFGSITLSAAQLGVPEPGGAVWVQGWASMGTPGVEAGTVCVVTANIFGDLADLLDEIDEDEFAELVAALVAAGVGTTDVEVFFDISAELCAAIGTAPGVFSWHVAVGDDIPEIAAEYGAVAGVYKQVAGASPVTTARTTSADRIVDGYTGLNGTQITTATNEYVVPIVQTNNEWNTQIRLTNFSDAGTTPYSITIYEAGGSGALGPSVGAFTGSFAGGETVTYNLLDEGFPTEFVGAAFIETNAPVGAVAERVKDLTNMLIMTTSRPVAQDAGDHVAPLVFQDWNFWNTGISTANTGEATATVTYNYHPPLSGFTQDQRNIAPRTMEYVYRPGGQEVGIGTVGAAILRSNQTHASTVDEVKYFGELPDVGHAMSYATVPWNDLATDGEGLALPLFQRGNPMDDTGDTSGIQLFNASADNSITFEATIYNTAGNPVAPTLFQPISETLAPRDNFTIYAHDLAELPVGFQGSVIIRVTGGGALGAVSNNVNYAVQYDGSAAFNLVNIPALPDPLTPELIVEPPVSENPFYTDLAWGQATEIAALGIGFFGDDVQTIYGIIQAEGPETADFVAYLEGLVAADEITEEEFDLIVAAWLGVNVHTVEARVELDGEVLTDWDFDAEVRLVNQFGVPLAGIDDDDIDIDVENGIATITYERFEGQFDLTDQILVTASIGDDDDVLILGGMATKTWVVVEPELLPQIELIVLERDGDLAPPNLGDEPIEVAFLEQFYSAVAILTNADGTPVEAGIDVDFEVFIEGVSANTGTFATGAGSLPDDNVAQWDFVQNFGSGGDQITWTAEATIEGVTVSDSYTYIVVAPQ